MIRENILYFLASRWSSPMVKEYAITGVDTSSDEYHLKYALYKQYLYKANQGFPFDFYAKRILEIGCGHGGISVFLAVNGAKEVCGIDINTYHLSIASQFKKQIEDRLKVATPLPVLFREMNANALDFPDASIDMVVADNIFEHIMDLESMLSEISRVLTKGGQLVIPAFNSIYSKYGLHLKHGLKMPWANVFSVKELFVR
jgi:ubiquinone/menaquinone biosynthesis C-methylase UbiE